MLKTSAAVALLVSCCASAQAAPPVSEQVVVGTSNAHKYWLSEDLNRLVFWKAPAPRQETRRN